MTINFVQLLLFAALGLFGFPPRRRRVFLACCAQFSIEWFGFMSKRRTLPKTFDTPTLHLLNSIVVENWVHTENTPSGKIFPTEVRLPCWCSHLKNRRKIPVFIALFLYRYKMHTIRSVVMKRQHPFPGNWSLAVLRVGKWSTYTWYQASRVVACFRRTPGFAKINIIIYLPTIVVIRTVVLCYVWSILDFCRRTVYFFITMLENICKK